MARDRAFIVPVCLDATKEAGTDVPESFHRVQWTRLLDGNTPPPFTARVIALLCAPGLRYRKEPRSRQALNVSRHHPLRYPSTLLQRHPSRMNRARPRCSRIRALLRRRTGLMLAVLLLSMVATLTWWPRESRFGG